MANPKRISRSSRKRLDAKKLTNSNVLINDMEQFESIKPVKFISEKSRLNVLPQSFKRIQDQIITEKNDVNDEKAR